MRGVRGKFFISREYVSVSLRFELGKEDQVGHCCTVLCSHVYALFRLVICEGL